jgi:hypothetical protein
MKMNIKRHLVCMIFVSAILLEIGTLMNICGTESEMTANYFSAGDPDVSVHTEIKSVKAVRQDVDGMQFRVNARIRLTNVSANPIFLLRGLASEFPIQVMYFWRGLKPKPFPVTIYIAQRLAIR